MPTGHITFKENKCKFETFLKLQKTRRYSTKNSLSLSHLRITPYLMPAPPPQIHQCLLPTNTDTLLHNPSRTASAICGRVTNDPWGQQLKTPGIYCLTGAA